MIVYPDTSLIVALFTQDAHADAAWVWLTENDPDFVFSTWTLAEFSSALNLQQRQGRLDEEGVEKAERLLTPLIAVPSALAPTLPEDVVVSRDIVRRFDYLRAPDALHLAICRRVGLTMASFDGKLNRGAQALGIDCAF